jgi:hypothetical protein
MFFLSLGAILDSVTLDTHSVRKLIAKKDLAIRINDDATNISIAQAYMH